MVLLESTPRELKEIPAKYKKVIAEIKVGGGKIRFESPLIPLEEKVTREQGIEMIKKFLLSLRLEPQLTTALLAPDNEGLLQMQKIEPIEFNDLK